VQPHPTLVPGACGLTDREGRAATALAHPGRGAGVWHRKIAGLEPPMSAPPATTRLKRFKDIATLVLRYRHSELARAAADEAIEPAEPTPELEREAEQLAAELERLGPTFIKLGQLLSTRADVLPPAALDALARLQDDVEPFGFEEAERIVSEELGIRLSKAFASFEAAPLAAASLGQVHRATLRDGRPVVVKVQRPGIRDRVVGDLEDFERLAGVLDRRTRAGERYRFGEMIDEFRKTLLAELDYRREAQHMVLLGRNLARFTRIIVPQPVEDYSSGRVLTMDYVQGTKVTALSPLAFTEIDGNALVDTLFRAYLRQVFVDGFFHADPHAGNVFLTGDGRIALLDLGQVARLSTRLQQHLLQLTMAVADGRSDEAADYALKMSETEPRYNERDFRRRLNDVVVASQDLSVGKLRVGSAFMDLARAAGECGVHPPPALSILGKTMLQLDQIGRTIAPDFDPNASIRRNAVRLLNQRVLRTLRPSTLFSGALELKDLVDRLPARINRVLDAAADNRLGLKLDTGIDADQLMVGLQKVANRVATGLILAALIVGAAQLMRVETSFRILGYPGLAMLCFLAAAGGGVFLLVHSLIGDVRRRGKTR
jgi:predicted unusual protein kinase regulating ubiquinone biosynthesis (AarF/ABC1/UbiB family)